MRKLAICLSIMTAFGLVACGKKNPLLNDETIGSIKQFVAFDPDDKEFDTECKNYLLGKESSNTALKARCDKTVDVIYRKFKSRDAFQQATREDLNDPKLWERVFSR